MPTTPFKIGKIFARFGVGAIKFVFGFLFFGIMLHASFGELSFSGRRTSYFDQTQWFDAAALSFSDDNPRYYMISDVLQKVNESRPDRQNVLVMLGNPMIAEQERTLVYWVGSPSIFISRRLLVISFEDDGAFKKAEIEKD